MTLPLRPPVQPMLARLARELPAGDYCYEPKWDGFRCLAFRDGGAVDLRSRNDRPLARYFPEVVDALLGLAADAFVLDGELLVIADGRADFEALLARLHPAASRSTLLSRDTPACFVAFDVLAENGRDTTTEEFGRRRVALEALLRDAPPRLSLTPMTTDQSTARQWLEGAGGGGIDGVVAKSRALTYQPGKRAMIKVKRERTADCVVAGARLFEQPLGVASLLLGLYDDGGVLHHVGVASSFTRRRQAELLEDLAPFVTAFDGHPWEHGFGMDSGRAARLPGAATRWTPAMTPDWVPVRPELVCEVAYEHVEGGRFRHPARFRRWRPDRDAQTCRGEQLDAGGGLSELLPS